MLPDKVHAFVYSVAGNKLSRATCILFLGIRCLGPLSMQLTAGIPALLQVAIGLRSVSRGYIPDKAFILVSLAVTAFMLIGWRTGLAALTKVCSVLFSTMTEYICKYI